MKIQAMLILLLFMSCTLLFLLPFLPGIIEMVREEDADPLFIPMEYIKDPCYFGKSFRHLIQRATEGVSTSPGIRDAKLSREEKLEIVESANIPDGVEKTHLLYVTGNLSSGNHVRLIKEVYVARDTTLGPNNIIQALAADGNVKVGVGTQLRRWLNAKGSVDISEDCSLGVSVSCNGKLYLGRNCHFRRLYGIPIVTHNDVIPQVPNVERPLSPTKGSLQSPSFSRRKERVLEPGTVITDNIVFLNDVTIGCASIIRGSIKSYGRLTLGENVIIDGSVFAEGDITIGSGAKISGHILSQMGVFICEQTTISSPATLKTIIGKKAIRIDHNVTIYGYVVTEGDGTTV